MAANATLQAATSYNVAWIAALPHERSAALLMLDERHNKPKDFIKNASDQNSYSWGRIGDHNVVIASLPAGEYGTTSAADTVSSLRASLSHIRIGLLVGIGAGVAKYSTDDEGNVTIERDILLGDVVVSSPDRSNGGVVQHDLYKAKVENSRKMMELKGFLKSPPRVLRSALSNLQAEHEIEDSRIEAFLEVFQKNEKTKTSYRYPGSDMDHLRVELHRTAKTKLTDQTNGDVIRETPKIHYGTIASGNILIKDGDERDEIVAWFAQNNIDPLCFEMEAAGLMNSFPCLVIRGICDYADEHKNDIWQRYAAATAAAFAKECLGYVDVQEVETSKTIADLLRSVQDVQKDIHSIQSDTTVIKDIAVAQQTQLILDWLCREDYSKTFNMHMKTYLSGTGDWFLNSKQFRAWMVEGDTGDLYCPGAPGAGKTIMATRVIDYLQRRQDGPFTVLYLFCDYGKRGQQTLPHFLRALIWQATFIGHSVPSPVDFLYRTYRRSSTQPTENELLDVLRSVVSDLPPTYIVIDALDECDRTTCRDLITSLRSLIQSERVKCLWTSRPIPDIDVELRNATERKIYPHSRDIEAYVHTHINELEVRVGITPVLRQRIVSSILTVGRGLFLLARLNVQSLKTQTNIRDLETALANFVSGLNDAYDTVMERIASQEDELCRIAHSVISWVVYAKRPLMVTELQHALATREGDEDFDPKGITKIELLLSACAGLVVVGEEYVWHLGKSQRVLRLVHTTTQEYFERASRRWFPTAAIDIARTCITYFTFDEFASGPVHDKEKLRERHARYPFLSYACSYAGKHAADAEDSDCTVEDMNRLANTATRLLERRAAIDSAYEGSVYEAPTEKAGHIDGHTVWHYLASNGLVQLHRLLRRTNEYCDACTSEGISPLVLAIRCKKTEMAAHLLGSEVVDMNARTSSGVTSLWLAVREGYENVVRILVELEVDVNSGDFADRTPLIYAVGCGRLSMVDLLLASDNIKVNEQDRYGNSALSLAASGGDEKVLEGLLQCHKLDFNARHDNGLTALMLAAKFGNYSAVKLLIQSDAIQLDLGCDNNRTALSYAAGRGHERIISLLLHSGLVDVNSKDFSGVTPLLHATFKQQENVIRLLLQVKDLQANSTNVWGLTAMMIASLNGHLDLVKLFLQSERVDLNLMDPSGENALFAAAQHGHEDVCLEIVLHLLRRDRDECALYVRRTYEAVWQKWDSYKFSSASQLAPGLYRGLQILGPWVLALNLCGLEESPSDPDSPDPELPNGDM